MSREIIYNMALRQKIPVETLTKLEDRKLIHKIPKELGIDYKYSKGQSLVLVHNDPDILDLAADTMNFWISPPANLKSCMIPLLENKKVVWKFHGEYARKAVHLFQRDLTAENLGNDAIVNNNREKNVCLLEIFCEYNDFAKVNPKINGICRDIEALPQKTIVVKQSDKIKARQFVHRTLDDDGNVLCLFKEKESRLEIFGKSEETVNRVEKEFNEQVFKMTGRGKPRAQYFVQSQTTTAWNMNANSTQTPRVSINEPRTDNLADSLKEESGSDSERDFSQLIVAADDKRESFGLSSRDMSKSKSSRDETVGALYSQGRTIGAGSRFRYEFDLNGMTVSVYKESIVAVKDVDAIVNAANEQMAHGGGVAYYISRAAGKAMDYEGKTYVVKYGPVPVGKNCITTAGKLPYKGIIHAVGPQWADYIGNESDCAKDLYLTIKNVLRSTKDNAWRRVALCAISAGMYFNHYYYRRRHHHHHHRQQQQHQQTNKTNNDKIRERERERERERSWSKSFYCL